MYEILKNKEELQNKSFHKTNKSIKVSILEFSSLVPLIGNTLTSLLSSFVFHMSLSMSSCGEEQLTQSALPEGE